MPIPPEYERIRSRLLRPVTRQVQVPLPRPCVPPDEAPSLPDIATAFHYGTRGPDLHAEVLEPLLDQLGPQLLVACSGRILGMLMPFWEEFRSQALPLLARLEAQPPNRSFPEDIARARGWVEGQYEHDIGGPPSGVAGFLRWLLEWPDRVLAQTAEWTSDPGSEPYPALRAGAIFNALREVAIGYLERAVSDAADPRTVGWWTFEQVVRGIASTTYWQAEALRPTDFTLDPQHEINQLIRNRARNCIASAASPIGWRVELQELRSRDWGMTRRLFGEPRGEMVPARPGRLVPLPPEVEERARRIVAGFYATWWRECLCRFPVREGPALVVEGPPDADPFPMPPDNFTTLDLIAQLGFGRVQPGDLLGFGGFGEAWRLPDGRVIKFTTSPAEAHCVEFLAKHSIESPHLPRVDASGHLESGTAHWFVRDLDDSDLRAALDEKLARRVRWRGWGPLFWYVREELDDVRPSDPWNITGITIDLWTRLGILPMDISRVSNWGKRPGTGELVLRDLACSTPEAHFSGETRDGAVVQYPATRIDPRDVPSFLADRERGRPDMVPQQAFRAKVLDPGRSA